MAHETLKKAKDRKSDEFYTQLSEIQTEVSHYSDKFKNKVVFCNCDDPFESNFVKYFLMNFNRLGLKELIATGYKTSPVGGTEIGEKNTPYALRVTDTTKYLVGTQKDLDIRGAKYFLETEGNRVMTQLIGNVAVDKKGKPIMQSIKEEYVDENNIKKTRTIKQSLYYEAGDFRSDMSIALLKQSDIVVTNCPFSLFREFVAQLMEYEKQFLIIGNMNAITYKEFFPLIKANKVWVGYGFNRSFIYTSPYKNELEANRKFVKSKGYDPDTHIKVHACCWFTNIDHPKRHQILPLDLGYTYKGHEDMYPQYDNYNAINIDKVSEIPCDYEPCWYKCPYSQDCKYAQTEGKEDNALCENFCNGAMGVPITFLGKHCAEQFEVINANDIRKTDDINEKPHGLIKDKEASISINNCSQFVNVERERERERETNNLCKNRCSQDAVSVTAFLECQSPSLISSAQSNSESLDSTDMLTTTQNTDTDSCLKEKKLMQEFSFKKCNGIIGVPISFLDKYCPEQFEIIKFRKGDDDKDLCINGKCPYFRILIKKKGDRFKWQ